MSVTIRLSALKRRVKTNGEVPIYIRVTKNRKYELISTNVAVPLAQWNEKSQEVRKSHPRSVKLNDELKKQVREIEDVITEQDNFSLSTGKVKDLLRSDTTKNFFEFAREFVGTLETDGNLHEFKQTKVLLDQLEDHLRKRYLEFSALDQGVLEGFRNYLTVKLGNNPNTVNKKMKRLKRITSKALRQGIIEIDPFRFFTPLKQVKPNKSRLDRSQIKAIEELQLRPNTMAYHVRNAFLFSFYNAGIRFGDLCMLEWKNIVDGRLIYQMGKTSSFKNVKLSKQSQAILKLYKHPDSSKDSYIFPFLDNKLDKSDTLLVKKRINTRNSQANNVLKRISALAGIETHVSFHVSRHSFADYARKQNMNLYDISKALGHSDIQTTQMYLASFDETSMDKEMDRLFGE